MKKLITVLLVFIISCGPSEAEIEERIETAVLEAIATSSTTTSSTTTSSTTTSSTTTSSTTTTTTIPRIKIYETITKTFEETVNRLPRDREIEEWLEIGQQINYLDDYDLVSLTLEIKESLEPERKSKGVAKIQQDMMSAMFGGDDDDDD